MVLHGQDMSHPGIRRSPRQFARKGAVPPRMTADTSIATQLNSVLIRQQVAFVAVSTFARAHLRLRRFSL